MRGRWCGRPAGTISLPGSSPWESRMRKWWTLMGDDTKLSCRAGRCGNCEVRRACSREYARAWHPGTWDSNQARRAMTARVWNIVFLVGFVVYCAIRGVYQKKAAGSEKIDRRRDRTETLLLLTVFVGNMLLPV